MSLGDSGAGFPCRPSAGVGLRTGAWEDLLGTGYDQLEGEKQSQSQAAIHQHVTALAEHRQAIEQPRTPGCTPQSRQKHDDRHVDAGPRCLPARSRPSRRRAAPCKTGRRNRAQAVRTTTGGTPFARLPAGAAECCGPGVRTSRTSDRTSCCTSRWNLSSLDIAMPVPWLFAAVIRRWRTDANFPRGKQGVFRGKTVAARRPANGLRAATPQLRGDESPTASQARAEEPKARNQLVVPQRRK